MNIVTAEVDMSWLHPCLNFLSRCFARKASWAATQQPPSQPDKAPTDKDKNNDQQQQQMPRKRTPLSVFQYDY